MTTVEDQTAEILRHALRRVTRSTPMPHILERDDLAQAAALALWEARHRFDKSRSDADQRGYIAKRGEGAMRDEVRRARGCSRADADPVFVDLANAPEESEASRHEGYAQVMHAIRAVLQAPHPLPLIFCALAAELPVSFIGAHLGLDPSRISQHKATLRALLTKHLETT